MMRRRAIACNFSSCQNEEEADREESSTRVNRLGASLRGSGVLDELATRVSHLGSFRLSLLPYNLLTDMTDLGKGVLKLSESALRGDAARLADSRLGDLDEMLGGSLDGDGHRLETLSRLERTRINNHRDLRRE